MIKSLTAFVRPLWTLRPRVLARLLGNFMWRGMWTVRRFERQKEFFPAFMMLSVTGKCNLNCRGCWVSPECNRDELNPAQICAVIDACRRHGTYFFGILGGEPLLYPGLLELFAKYDDCYFQLFTNGQLLTGELAKKLADLGNVTVLVSIEGLEEESKRRRRGNDVYQKSLAALDACRAAGLFYGVACSVCKSNIDELASAQFIDLAYRHGAHYLWYYIYRPAGEFPEPGNALDAAEITRLRQFIVDARMTSPVLMIDAYWDHLGRALCPGAMGLSHHLAPNGALEFCPPLQFAGDFLSPNGDNAETILAGSPLLKEMREFVRARTRGCPILSDPAALTKFLKEHGAVDSSARHRAYAEFEQMTCQACHASAKALPERHWLYYWGKKKYFFGFGAYG